MSQTAPLPQGGSEKQSEESYLLQTSALGPHEGHAVAVVDVGGHRGHAVASLGVQRVTGDQLGAAQRLVDVQAAEGVVDGHRLEREGRHR